MCQEYDQRHLPHKDRLASHVWSSQKKELWLLIKADAIWHKLASIRNFYHWMSTLLDRQLITQVDLWTSVLAREGNLNQAS